MCSYYMKQAQADNHAVREAACHAIAELATKVDQKCITGKLDLLLDSLKRCFEDDSWPVRDAACLASSRFLAAYKDLGAEKRVLEFVPLMWSQLEDYVCSVRQGAAESLTAVCAAYPMLVDEHIWPRLIVSLGKIVDQPSDSSAELETDPTGVSALSQFGVVKRIRDNDPILHTGQQMFSCGSLAPKMSRGGGAGCGGHSFRHPAYPWQITDGAVQVRSRFGRKKRRFAEDSR